VGLQREGLGPFLVDRRLNPFFAAQFADQDLPAELLLNDADLLFGGESSTGGLTNLFDDVWGHSFLL